MFIHHIPGTFHCNVIKDFRKNTIILRNMMESSDQKNLLKSDSRTTVRVEKRGFIFYFEKSVFFHHSTAPAMSGFYPETNKSVAGGDT